MEPQRVMGFPEMRAVNAERFESNAPAGTLLLETYWLAMHTIINKVHAIEARSDYALSEEEIFEAARQQISMRASGKQMRAVLLEDFCSEMYHFMQLEQPGAPETVNFAPGRFVLVEWAGEEGPCNGYYPCLVKSVDRFAGLIVTSDGSDATYVNENDTWEWIPECDLRWYCDSLPATLVAQVHPSRFVNVFQ